MARPQLTVLPIRNFFLLLFVSIHLQPGVELLASAFGIIGLRQSRSSPISLAVVSPEKGGVCGRWVPSSQRTNTHFPDRKEVVLVVPTLRSSSIALASLPPNNQDDEENYSNKDSNHDDKFAAFLDYIFREMDCQGEPGDVELRIDETTGRRGLYVAAKNGIAKGDYVFAVPMKSAWVAETTISSNNSEEEENDETAELSDAERGLRFWKWMQSNNNDDDVSYWKPYKEILPTREETLFDPTPDFWSEEQIRALEVPQIVKGALARKKSVRELAKKVSSSREDDSVVVSEDDLRFATWLVCSRAITVIEDDEKDEDEEEDEEEDVYSDNVIATTCVLVPLLDMINHSSENPNVYFSVLGDDGGDEDDRSGLVEDVLDDEENNENLYYAVIADRDLHKGEELLISYGSTEDSSADLLLQYGFLPESNPHDLDFWYWEVQESYNEYRDWGAGKDFAWATSLQDDEDRLAAIMSDDESMAIERTILEFRIRMKRAHTEALEIFWTEKGC